LKGVADFKVLVQQRTWDKDLLLWLGAEKSLLAALGANKYVTLDLLDLFQSENLPIDDEATKDELRRELRERLRNVPKGPDNRTVLVVKSIGLLARYETGLKEFYDWFVGSHTLVVLLMEDVPEKSHWPDEVRCDAKRLVSYFREPGMVKEVYAAKG
jgi:hypothetical protein